MMGLPKEPFKVIVPVLMTSDTLGSPYSVLGTGFFIDANGSFLSAGHVFKNNPLPKGRAYSVTTFQKGVEFYRVVDLKYSEKFDMAIGRAEGATVPRFLNIADKDCELNLDLLTVEFSNVTSRALPSGATEIGVIPSFHKGHAVSYRTSHFPDLEGANIVELSFPALKGASGAPIVIAEGESAGTVIGMVLGNLERHLLPAQVEKVEGETGEPTETTYYFLPHGYALGWQHLREFMEAVGTKEAGND